MIPTQQTTEQSAFTPIIDWIDGELTDYCLGQFQKVIHCEALLDIRHLFTIHHGQQLNTVLGGFYKILPTLEQHHYLLGYRIRQWFSYNFDLIISDPLERAPSMSAPLCQTMKSFDALKKQYFEDSDYMIPYHDIRVKVIVRTPSHQA